MIKLSTLILIFSLNSLLKSANTDTISPIQLYKIDIQIHTEEISKGYGTVSPFSSTYRGEFLEGIAHLLDVPLTRIKTSKDTPKQYFSYEVFRAYNVSELEQIVLKTLEKYFEFTINDTIDTCDIWRIVVVDSTKLDKFSYKKDSPDGTTGCGFLNNNQDREFFGQTMTALAYWMEVDSKKYIFVTDSNDTIEEPMRYKFVIPLKYIRDIQELKHFMYERYGIKLVSEKQVIEKKYLKHKISD